MKGDIHLSSQKDRRKCTSGARVVFPCIAVLLLPGVKQAGGYRVMLEAEKGLPSPVAFPLAQKHGGGSGDPFTLF